jgi:hypothetical protein
MINFLKVSETLSLNFKMYIPSGKLETSKLCEFNEDVFFISSLKISLPVISKILTVVPDDLKIFPVSTVILSFAGFG